MRQQVRAELVGEQEAAGRQQHVEQKAAVGDQARRFAQHSPSSSRS